MSIIGFTLRALAMSPQVFLRLLPALATYGLLLTGLFLSTDNPYVIFMILGIMGTYGLAFLIVTGLRAGLMTIRATTAPTVEGLMRVSGRMMFTHMLIQLVTLTAVAGGIGLAFYQFVLPQMAPDSLALIQALRAEEPMPQALLDRQEAILESLRRPAMLFSLAMSLAAGLVVGVFGVPMAAMAANAVQYSPRHDFIYGIGRYLPHQLFLYLVALALPSVLFALFAPAATLMPAEISVATLGMLGIGSAVYSFYAPCITFAGMALAYAQVRERVEKSILNERAPEVDRDAVRDNLRSLRLVRREERTGTKIYDPVARTAAAAPAAAPDLEDQEDTEAHGGQDDQDYDDEDYDDEDEDAGPADAPDRTTDLRSLRLARRQERSGTPIYDPIAARRSASAGDWQEGAEEDDTEGDAEDDEYYDDADIEETEIEDADEPAPPGGPRGRA